MPSARLAKPLPALVVTGSSLACLGAAHQLVNLRLLRRPPQNPPPVAAAVSLLVPARDEAHRIEPTIRSLLAQRGLADAEILVLDDGSSDGTADVVTTVAAGDPRLRVLTG
ncbi:MAG: glycosyltransferase, partial [Mycobacterium sp.]